jgi:prevent-host-death family protein
MEQAVSATKAHRKFSVLLRGVRDGRSYVVTSYGKPIARLIPTDKHDDVAIGAREALFNRLENQLVIDAGRCTRDELYENAG